MADAIPPMPLEDTRRRFAFDGQSVPRFILLPKQQKHETAIIYSQKLANGTFSFFAQFLRSNNA